jgi:hypothetical protein
MSDERWIDTVREAFRPEPMDPLRARAFERRLFARLEPRRPGRWLAAPLLAGALGALALWLFAQRPEPPSPATGSLHAFADPDAALAYVEPDDYLPDDYLALAGDLDGEAAGR